MSANNFDPVERGYVKSLFDPGGNITGVFTRQPELAQQQLELLTQAFPSRKHVAVLWNPDSLHQFAPAEQRAKGLGLLVDSVNAGHPPYDLAGIFQDISSRKAEMVLVLSSP